MPELMIDLISSLDGYAAADGWPGLWGMGGPEYLAWLGEQEEHTILMGATTYRLRLVLFPVINGATGRDRLFDGYPDVRLELLESRTFDGRLQLLDYRPTVLDRPPLA